MAAAANQAGTAYQTENIIISAQTQNAAIYAHGTYKKGQLLGRLADSGEYLPYDHNAAAGNGAEVIAALCPVDMTISAARTTGPVARGEFSLKGVKAVMASLSPAVILDEILIGQCWDAGIILN